MSEGGLLPSGNSTKIRLATVRNDMYRCLQCAVSRLRNMIEGQHHGVSPKYIHQYANHAAWLEDNRRTDNGTMAHIIVSNAMDAPVSCNWKGYWQRAA